MIRSEVNNETSTQASPSRIQAQAAALLVEHGYSCMAAGPSLGVNGGLIGWWKNELADNETVIFLGKGNRKPEPQRIHELESENRRLRMEGDILKSHGLICQGKRMRYQCIEKKKKVWPITPSCVGC